MGRRKFAKNAQDVRHFRLVSRSTLDAHADDPDAPALVLEPFVKPGDVRRTGMSEAELTQIPEVFASTNPEAFADPNAPLRDPNENFLESGEEDEDEDPEAALEGDCYFPKDGYNYDQHLRRVTGAGKKAGAGGGVGMVLEAPAKEKIPEELLKKQQAETQEQAELLRSLELADEYEELEEEGFTDLLPGGAIDVKEMLWGPRSAEEADLPDLAQFKAMHAMRKAMQQAEDSEGEEGLAGDGAPGTAPAARVEDAAAFEEFFNGEYGDDDDIGGCEEEEIEGEVELGDDILDEYLNDKQAENELLNSLNEPIKGKYDNVPRATDETKAIIQKHYKEVAEGDDETSDGEDSEDDESRTWDCESVLSTLSNVSNRPGKITRQKLIKKPVPAMKSLKEENENSGEEDESEEEDVVELPDVVTERAKDETAEEKRARKAGVKAMRKICRQMKKESKQTYKDEASKLNGRDVRSGDIKAKARTFKL